MSGAAPTASIGNSDQVTPPGRHGFGALLYLHNGLLWMIGGFTGKVRRGMQRYLVFYRRSQLVSLIPSPVWPARSAHSCSEFNDQLLVVAGSNGDDLPMSGRLS